MSELTLWAQVLFVLLPDPHNKNVFPTKFFLFMFENQMAVMSITLLYQLCGKKKPMPQHTKSRDTSASLPQISMSVYTYPFCSHASKLWLTLYFCLISLTWFLHHSWSGVILPSLWFVEGWFPPPLSLPSKMSEKVVQSTLVAWVGSWETEWGRSSG